MLYSNRYGLWMAALMLFTFLAWGNISPSRAEEDSEIQPAQNQPAQNQPAQIEQNDEQPGEEEAEPAAPESAAAENGAAQQRFEQKLEEWRGLLQDLRELRSRYQAASRDEVAAIQEEWNQRVAQGEELIPQLRQAAMDAYRQAPNADRVVLGFLVRMLEDEMNRDNYEPAYEIGTLLIEHESGVREVYDGTALAAFATNRFDEAEELFERAEQLGVLREESARFLHEVPSYRELWQEEQEIRQAEAEADDLPRVKLTTSKGELVVELFENEAPGTVGNFISLVEDGFYDGLTFHRVLPQFMAQGGCPDGDGTGGPGYHIYCEWHLPDHRKHFRGTLSMAHAGRDTGGSQFFLTFVPTPHLNGRHTAFGRVIEGIEVLARLQRIDPSEPSAVEPDRIIKAEVLRKRDHEYRPQIVGEDPPPGEEEDANGNADDASNDG